MLPCTDPAETHGRTARRAPPGKRAGARQLPEGGIMKNTMVEWSDELATGILWQDFQHAGLIARINRLHRAILAKEARPELVRMIDFLETYIENHFGMEERYMEVMNDPALRGHAREHQKFRDNLAELRQFGGMDAQMTAVSLCYDLYEWVTHHIRTTDKKLGRLLLQQDLK